MGAGQHRPDRREQVVGNGQTLHGWEGSGPRRIMSPHPLATDGLEQVPPPSIRRSESRFDDLGVVDVCHAAKYIRSDAVRGRQPRVGGVAAEI